MTRDPAEFGWHCWSNSPSSPVFHNLRRFTDAISPTAPTTGLPVQGNPVATADALAPIEARTASPPLLFILLTFSNSPHC